MDLGVSGRPLLIVGGTRGMGRAAAEVLAADGAHLAVVGRDADRAEAAAGELAERHGTTVVGIGADVAVEGDAARMVREAADALGGLRGIAVLTGMLGHQPVDEVSRDDWHRFTDDVLAGTVDSVRAAIPLLADAGGGSVVTTAAYSIRAPHAVRLPYASLKAAVAVFTKGIAKEHGRQGIRANCICPGAIETESLATMRAQLAQARGVPPEGLLEQVMVEEWHMSVALGRPGRPQEVGELIAFLLSDRAGYLTGATINIDGGTDF